MGRLSNNQKAAYQRHGTQPPVKRVKAQIEAEPWLEKSSENDDEPSDSLPSSSDCESSESLPSSSDHETAGISATSASAQSSTKLPREQDVCPAIETPASAEPEPLACQGPINQPPRMIPTQPPPSVIDKTEDQVEAIDNQWRELEHAINIAEKSYETAPMSNQLAIKISNELGCLREFNHRRRILNLAGSHTYSMLASKQTAENYFLRRPDLPSHGETGYGHAERIRTQAEHIITYKCLPEDMRGKSTKHPSILDDQEIEHAIIDWIAAHKTGTVRCLN